MCKCVVYSLFFRSFICLKNNKNVKLSITLSTLWQTRISVPNYARAFGNVEMLNVIIVSNRKHLFHRTFNNWLLFSFIEMRNYDFSIIHRKQIDRITIFDIWLVTQKFCAQNTPLCGINIEPKMKVRESSSKMNRYTRLFHSNSTLHLLASVQRCYLIWLKTLKYILFEFFSLTDGLECRYILCDKMKMKKKKNYWISPIRIIWTNVDCNLNRKIFQISNKLQTIVSQNFFSQLFHFKSLTNKTMFSWQKLNEEWQKLFCFGTSNNM